VSGEDRGYPADTAVDAMTPEQQTAYWKAQTRKHEERSTRWNDVDLVRARFLELSGAPTGQDHDEAREAAENAEHDRATAERTELRRSALRGELSAATGLTGDHLDVLMRAVIPDTFYADDGQVDRDAVAEFASTLKR
jgi:hypothetical protein